MVRCVMLYNNSESCNITLLNDDNVVVNCMGNYSLDSFLFNTGVDTLHVIFKPSVYNSVPENGFKIGNVSLNGVLKSCIISNEDVRRLADYSSIYGIKSIRLYNFLDLVVDRYKSEENVLVLMEWSNDIVGIAHIEMGELSEFRRVREDKLISILSSLRKRYKCNVVQFNSGFDLTNCHCAIHNLKMVDRDKQIFLSHIPYVIENKGIEILESLSNNLISEAFNIDDEGDSIYSKSSDKESNFDVSTDIDSLDISSKGINVTPKKAGFFSRLFGNKSNRSNSVPQEKLSKKEDKKDKLRKEKGFNFEDYDEVEEDEDSQYFSQVAQGTKPKALHGSLGANPGVKRKLNFLDYVFYTVFVLFFSCAIIVGGLQFVYKSKLEAMTGEYDSAVKVKNQMETNVRLSEDNSKSPATKITQLSSLNLPSSYKIRNVDYDGSQYKINVETAHNDNIDSIREYLPSDLVIGSINSLDEGDSESESNKIYEVILVVS